MKSVKACLSTAVLVVLFLGVANAMPLSSSGRAVVPARSATINFRGLPGAEGFSDRDATQAATAAG